MKKTVLITGASAGMGRETAELLASRGYTVYAAARRIEKMKDLEPLGIKVLSVDVTNNESMEEGIKNIIAAEGSVDILINSAGFGAYGAIEDVSIKDAKYQLDVNVFGIARLIQLVLPKMREQSWGKIVNISSIGGKFATPYGGWYHASKFALEGLSDALRNEVKQFGIDVIIVEPGGVKTEWGGIAYDNLIKNSVDSPYIETIDKLAGFLRAALDKNAEPIVIAKLIQQAVEAKVPKLRYVGGYSAKSAVLARKILSDRMFDKMMMSQIK